MAMNTIDALEGDFVAPHMLKDKRRTPRRQAVLPIEAILLDEPGRPAVPIKSRDLTGRGMGFASPYAFTVGQRLVVKLRLVSGQCDLILGRVRHSATMAKGMYRGGVEFLAVRRMAEGKVTLPEEWE